MNYDGRFVERQREKTEFRIPHKELMFLLLVVLVFAVSVLR